MTPLEKELNDKLQIALGINKGLERRLQNETKKVK